MTYLQTKDRAITTLNGQLLDTEETSFVVTDGSVFPDTNFVVTIEDEQILITSRSTNTLTIGERGYGDTVAVTHATLTIIELRIISKIIEELQDEKLDTDQTTPQTIVNGIPLLDASNEDFTDQDEIVNKRYVDSALVTVGTRFYMLDAADAGVAAYKATSLSASAEATANVSASANAEADTLIEEWISPTGLDWTTLQQGVYDLNAFVEKTAGNRDVRVFWRFYERKTDTSEVLIATSNLGDLVTDKERQRLYATLSADYTPDAGSRLVGKVYMNTDGGSQNTTCVVYYRGDEDSHWQIPVNQDFLNDTYEQLSNKKTDLSDDSDTFYPTQKAVKTAVDGKADKDSPVFTTKIQTPTVELGHASDTTLARKEAGQMNIEGKQALTEDNTVTVTGKRITPRSSTTTSTGTLTPALATANVWQLTAQEEALTIAAPTGTPVLGEVIHILIKDKTEARAITWNATYKALGEALLVTTTISKRLEAIAVYDGTDWLTSTVNEI